MVSGARRLTLYLVCCLIGLAVSPVIAMGKGSPSTEGTGASSAPVEGEELLPAEREAQLAGLEAELFGEASSTEGSSPQNSQPAEGTGGVSLLESGLVTPGSLVEVEETQAEREAKLDSPEAVSLREESRTKFEGLDPEQAIKVAGEAFPALVNELAGGPPKLPAGERIVGFPSDNAAQIDLPGGKHGVIESTAPIAVETSPGQRMPVDLSLNDVGKAFEPKMPAVGVKIPKQLGEGVQLSSSGVSLTPATEQGAALGGSEGALNGAAVFYADTQTNTDTLAKPMAGGFEIDSLLRSVDSPEVLYFKVGMPAGASLVSDEGPGGARVVLDGQTIAGIALPSAQDAAGTNVPVKMSVSGSTLVVTVKHGASEYQYPIAVDPRAYDYTMPLPSNCENYSGEKTNWEFAYGGGSFRCYTSGYGDIMDTVGGANVGEYDEFRYPAHGQASVTYINGEMQASASEQSAAVTKDEFVHGTPEVEHRWTNAGESFSRQLIGSCDQPVIEEGVEHCRALNTENELRIVQTDTARENVPEGYGFWFELYNGTWVSILQEKGPEASFNTSEATIDEGRQNVLYGSGGWLGAHNGAVEVTAKDPGLGVSDVKIKDLTAGAHGEHWTFNDPIYEDKQCYGVWCNVGQTFKTHFTYSPEMAEGANTFEVCAEDEAAMKTCTDATVKVDNTPPANFKLKGIAENGTELNAMPHQVTVEATDATSGVKSIAVSLDGKEIGSPAGSCSPGECTASRAVTIDGESLGAGEHKLKVTAFDNADNEAPPKEYTFAIRNATPVHVGPGSVDPVTGQFALTASDVNIAGAGRVSRTYLSRSLSLGVEGPFGPQWSFSFGTGQSLNVLPNGNVELRSSAGEPTTFEKDGTKFIAPKGDEIVTLESKEKEGKIVEYLLKEPTAGATVRFTLPSGSKIWVPEATEGPAERDTIRYAYRTVEPVSGTLITEPTEVLGLVPANVTCGENPKKVNLEALKPGCRALSFTYAETTTATGEGSSEWGEYKGRLMKVSFTGYNTTGKKMETIAVAQYAYDKQGRLRAEWDPRISPALKTTYGYDAEGHVTALTPPGQESWAFTYGTIPSDGSPGRLLKVMRPPASGGLWGGKLPSKTEAPKLSGSPVVGVKMSVSNGAWENGPVAYAYQWEDCNSSGGECTPILGATNANYTVAASDVGHSLVAQVSAINGGGTALASSLASATAEFTAPGMSPSYTQSVDSGHSVNAVSCVPGTTDCVVSDSAGKELYATNVSASSAATWNTWSGPSEQSPSQAVDCPTTALCILADGKETAGGTLYYATSLGGSWEKAYSPAYGVDAISCVSSPSLFCVDGQDNYGYFRYSTKPASTEWTLEYQGEASMKGVFCLSSSFCAIADGVGDVHIADSTSQIESSSWTSTDVDGTTALNGVACTSTTSCVAVDGAGNVINLAISGSTATATKHDIDGTNDLTAITCTGSSTCVTVDNQGNVFVSTNGGESWTKELTLGDKLTSVSCASASLCVTADTTGNVTAFYPNATQSVDSGNSVNAVSCLPGTTDCVLSDSKGNAFYATNVSTTSPATWSTWSGPSGESPSEALACPATSLCVMATGEKGKAGIYYASALGGAWTLGYSHTSLHPWDAVSCGSTSFCVAGETEERWIAYSTSPASTSWKEKSVGGGAGSVTGIDCLSGSFCAAVDTTGHVHVTTTGAEGTWTETDVDGTSALHGVACTSTTSCVAIDGAGNVLKLAISEGKATATNQNIDSTNDLTAITCPTSAICVAVDNQGNVFASGNGGESWSKQYALSDKLTSVSCTSSSLCVAVDTTGNVTTFDPVGPVNEGETRSPQPGTTIEYRVPLSGSGAPHEMTSTELAKWGQTKDLPEQATAIFPPDEPMGWPAVDYKRASVGYMDAQAREVDAASPSGGISTTEYNSLNEVTRTLSAADRALALKEGSKSAEVAEKLDSENKYNGETKEEKEQEEKEVSEKKKTAVEPGVRLLETYGPEHKIRLANGTEEETRNHKTFSYNEEAPLGEAHDLVTKATEWAETTAKEVLGKHETFVSYNGQEKLGWKLRKPTLVTSTVEGHTTTKAMSYEKETGNVLETTSSVSTGAPVYASQFGSEGKGNGQFTDIAGMAEDATGEVLAVDSGNDRVQEFSTEGGYLSSFGSKGTGNAQFEQPWGIAVNKSTGNIYVTDSTNDRVQELSSSGAFIRAWGFGVSDGKAEFEVCASSCKAGISGSGSGQFSDPLGIAIDSSGNVWVVDSGNNRVEEFSPEGAYIKSVGSKGSGKTEFKEPKGIAFSGKNLYVSDYGNNRIEELSGSGTYLAEFGTKGSGNGQLDGPYGIAADPVAGDLYVTDSLNNRVQEFTTAGVFMTKFGSEGTGTGQFKDPLGLTINNEGSVYVGDSGNSRVEAWGQVLAAPVYTSKVGTVGSENGQLKEPRGTAMAKNGNVYVLDTANNRVEEFSPTGTYLNKFGASGVEKGDMSAPYAMAVDAKGDAWIADTGNDRIDEFNEKREFVQAFGFGVSNGEAKLEVCTTTCKAGTAGEGSGQLKEPKGIAVTAGGDVYVSDSANNRMEEFTEKGEFVAAFGFGVSNEKAEYEICTTGCKAGVAGSGNGQFNAPRGVAVTPAGDLWVVDYSNNRIEEFNEKAEYVSKFGSKGTSNGQLNEPKGIAVAANGNVLVADSINNRVQEFTPSGTFLKTFGAKGTGNGQFEEPWGVAVAPSGAMYVADVKNNRVEEWTPAPRPGNEGANDTQTVYYTAKGEAEVATCQNHPEWAGLVCQTEPAAQPGDSGPPPLPVTTTTYNTWDEPETVIEQIGSVARTTTKKYDGAGREVENEETSTSSEDKALPAIADEYSTETGALVKLTATIEGKARTIASVYNTLGQLTSYTDAEGSTTKYSYDADGRVEEMSEPKGSQSYTYNTTTGFLEKLQDNGSEGKTGAGMFAATYGVAGEMLTEGYPNGMTAKYTYNTIGQATNLEYEKRTSCSEKCVWFSDTEAFGPKGEAAYQASTLSSEKYSYNEAGQLTQTQETPVGGKGCITRLYGYNEASGERESLTTREPNEKEECTTEGGAVEGHFYDAAGRLLDPGVTYDALGNMTKVPALDAGGQAITSSFYVDNQTAVQEQDEKNISYTYDPAGRAMIAMTKTKSSSSATISHYAGPGNALTWTCEEAGECKEEKETKWTRNIPGIDGVLDAIQTNGGTPVLELHDLQGNIVATAADNETETKLLTTHNNTEFGVPVGTAPKYSWLGADGAESELGTGVITEAGASYVPQVARTLQTEQAIPPGAAPNGVMDTEAYCPPELPWANQSGNEGAANTLAEQRALEVVTGTAADPWGLVTGEEAREFAAEFNGWANDVENFLENAEHCDAECEAAGEADIKADKWYAKGLEVCHHEVHNPTYRKYNGKTYETTYVCLLHLDYTENFGNWIFAKGDSNIWVCDSLPFDGDGPSPWGDHNSQEWLCEVEGKEQWWVFGNNRGWWRKIL
jgi:YD repeat-containing protein